jgi:hypothetical protein
MAATGIPAMSIRGQGSLLHPVAAFEGLGENLHRHQSLLNYGF